MKYLRYLLILSLLTFPAVATSMGISYEDETSYTSMRFGPEWFDGEILTGIYTADWSGGVDSWAQENYCVVTGNEDGVTDGTTSKDNCLKITVDGTSGYHRAKRETILSSGTKYKIVVHYYIPSQSNVDGFVVNLFTGLAIDLKSTGSTPATIGKWDTATGYATATDTRLRVQLYDGSAASFQDAGADDYIAISSIVISTYVSLSTQSFSGNLLIADDGSGNKAYGYIGAAATGEAKTALSNNVTAITKANPGVVSSTAHGLVVGDLVYFSGLNEMTELNGKYKNVTVVGSADVFSINDTSGYGAAETTGGVCASEVTEPNACAVTIYKERGLVNEGWHEIEASFDYNAGAAFNFDVHRTGRGAYNW